MWLQVEEWVLSAGVETVGQCWDELRFIRQAVEFLVLGAKQKKMLGDIQQNLCSELSVQQLYRISTMYWDDKYGTETVSGEVLQQMRSIMQVRRSLSARMHASMHASCAALPLCMHVCTSACRALCSSACVGAHPALWRCASLTHVGGSCPCKLWLHAAHQ
jgi:hypothetical protein